VSKAENDVMLHKLLGMDPEREFPFKYKVFSFVSDPRLEGTVPVNILLNKPSTPRFVNPPMDAGMGPNKLLILTLKYVSDVSRPIEDGNVPDSDKSLIDIASIRPAAVQ